MGHASRSGGLLRLEASHARVSQSGLKSGGGATSGGACGTIVEVVSGSSWRRTGQCNGCVRPCNPTLPFSMY
jgi:hypothetical protein